jgi:hypothetical protein
MKPLPHVPSAVSSWPRPRTQKSQEDLGGNEAPEPVEQRLEEGRVRNALGAVGPVRRVRKESNSQIVPGAAKGCDQSGSTLLRQLSVPRHLNGRSVRSALTGLRDRSSWSDPSVHQWSALSARKLLALRTGSSVLNDRSALIVSSALNPQSGLKHYNPWSVWSVRRLLSVRSVPTAWRDLRRRTDPCVQIGRSVSLNVKRSALNAARSARSSADKTILSG